MQMKNNEFYFIAEIGVNHEGCLDKALEMVQQVSDAGAHAAKFQVYKAESLVVKSAESYWDTNFESTKSQYELFKKYDKFNEKEYDIIHKKCMDCGIDFLATPFDLEAVEMLDKYSNSFKIASADLTNVPLLEKVANKRKHIFISSGASTLNEVEYALHILENNGAPSISLLHCVLNYPCSIKNSYLSNIKTLKSKFETEKVSIGYSDHIPTSEVNDDQLIVALTMGCRVFERHYTYNKMLPGNDHYHALDFSSLQIIIKRINNLMDTLVSVTESELLSNQKDARLQARRSIIVKKAKTAGETLNIDDLICKRPGTGISPLEIDNIIGKVLAENVPADTILEYKHIR